MERSPAIPFAVAALAIALFSGMDAIMKHLSLAIGTYNALLWRTGLGVLIGGGLFLVHRCAWPSRSVLRVHLERGVLAAAMAVLFFWGLARVPMAQAIALAFIAPIISLFLAALVLKERIERGAVLASLLGLAGVIVIFIGQAQAQLGREAFLGSLAIVASACLYAYNIILMRRQALVAGPVEVAFFMSLITTGLFALGAPALAQVPDAVHWLPILAAACLAIASHLLLAWAYARAQAQHLAPSEYTAFIWASLLGWLVFNEPVGPWTLAGAAMIVAACWTATRRRPAVVELEAGL